MALLALRRMALVTLAGAAQVGCSLDLGSYPGSDIFCLSPPQGPAPAHSISTTSDGCTTWSCEPGWTDCGAGACGTYVRNDAHNCGECGSVCPKGVCTMGSCQAIDTIASGLSSPDEVAISSGQILVDEGSGASIESWPVDGGTMQVIRNTGQLGGFVVDSTGLYFADVSNQTVSLERGPSLAPVATLSPRAGALALGDGSVWWLDQRAAAEGWNAGTGVDAGGGVDGGGRVDGGAGVDGGVGPTALFRASESDFSTQLVATVPVSSGNTWFFLPPLLAVSGGDAFIGSLQDLVVVRAGTSTPRILASDSLPIDSVVADDAFVYWNAGVIPGFTLCILCGWEDAGPPPPQGFRRAPLGGGAVQTLASEFLSPVAVSGGQAWGAEARSAGDVLVRIDGVGTRTVLAGGLGSINGVAVDAANVYWTVQTTATEGSGLLLRTAR